MVGVIVFVAFTVAGICIGAMTDSSRGLFMASAMLLIALCICGSVPMVYGTVDLYILESGYQTLDDNKYDADYRSNVYIFGKPSHVGDVVRVCKVVDRLVSVRDIMVIGAVLVVCIVGNASVGVAYIIDSRGWRKEAML